MKIKADQFWNLLSESRLLAEADLVSMREKYSLPDSGDRAADASQIARAMVAEQVLTPLQGKVLLSGHAGPFVYGRYQLMTGVGVDDVFLAIDRATRHPVWLHFFAGSETEDLVRWDRIEACAEVCGSLDGPNTVAVYEAVATPQYRFVVTGMPAGDLLRSKLPEKSKLSLKQASWIGLQAALAVESLDDRELGVPGKLLDHLWLGKVADDNGKARKQLRLWLSPVFVEGARREDNGRKLARLQWRLLSGREAPEASEAKESRNELEKRLKARVKEELPGSLCKSVCDCLVGDAQLSDLVAALTAHVGDRDVNLGMEVSGNREVAFVESLVPWSSAPQRPEVVPEVADVGEHDQRPSARPKRGMSNSAVLALSMFSFAALIAMAAGLATLRTVKTQPIAVALAENDSGKPDVESVVESNAEKIRELEQLTGSQSYVQEIVDDDQQTLWESPTAGFPIQVRFVPRAPRMLARLDWERLRESQSGQRAIASLGPAMQQVLDEMEAAVAVSRSRWKRSTITWHTNEQFQYQWCVHVELADPMPVADLLAGVEHAKAPGLDVYESKSRFGWWVTESDQGQARSFLFGPAERVKAAADGEIAVLTGTLKRLVEQTDSSRHVTLLSTTAALFNSEAEDMTGEMLRPFMREFRSRLPASVQGLLLSLHFDDADYMEVRLDHSADVSSREMVSLAGDSIDNGLIELTDGFNQLTAPSYWEPVRKRFSAMTREVARDMRWDTEFGSVIGNVWLRPGAVHNLIAATELAVSFPAQANVEVEVVAVPQTIEELLATRRDLSVANPPDLNVLLKEIAAEVSDQYLELPFEFVIQIAGADLQKEGITQNQRPAALNIRDQSLAEILTQVMVASNPNRNISGPSDKNCKLVWVIANDSANPGQKLVLVTTRAAATENGYSLPVPFVTP